jgi:predicted HicB family RNase H-like nuclease
MPKIGRPKLPKRERRGKLLGVRFTDAERRELDAAANAAGKTLSQWARDTLLDALASR